MSPLPAVLHVAAHDGELLESCVGSAWRGSPTRVGGRDVQERRRRHRVLIRRAVDVAWDQRQATGWARDISLGGMYVQSQQQPRCGSDVRVTVRFRHGAAVSIPARVCRSDESGFAVEFGAIGQLEADTIRRVLAGA